MMDAELSLNDVDIEDGELSDTSEEVYTPLQRPASLTHNTTTTAAPVLTLRTDAKCTKMDADGAEEDKTTKAINNLDDEDECQSDDYSSSSGDSSDTCLDKGNKDKKIKNKKRHIKRTVMVRIHPTSDGAEQKKTQFKKYDIWTAALQEEALTENMRGCDVTRNGFNDRSVENYDFSLRYSLNGENSLKRRLSNSNDDLSDNDQPPPHSKRQKPSSRADVNESSTSSSSSSRRPVHERLGKRRDISGRRRSSPHSGGSDSNSYVPKHIEDLEEIEGRASVEVAREIAMKLREEKDDLLVRVVEVLGTELPLKIYKETQRIEAEGGMTIKNGQRRRTPGGVFLFLLKHHDSLKAEDLKAIFSEDRNNANKKQKDYKAIMRDRKVKELKKRLCEQGAELPSLNTRKELMLLGDEINQNQNDGNLSNPPPSPEAYEHLELDLKSIPINHVTNDVEVDVAEKPSTSHGIESKTLQTYEDDFLDVNCGDMDFF
ncbi:phosphorylated adapter RNA export protein [Calliphora vicina]|uniref:phosphorylated adapter RNA export protein n=1 Tax=Calliphora vicina TaxID=7373 RepID=UPI00325AB485